MIVVPSLIVAFISFCVINVTGPLIAINSIASVLTSLLKAIVIFPFVDSLTVIPLTFPTTCNTNPFSSSTINILSSAYSFQVVLARSRIIIFPVTVA